MLQEWHTRVWISGVPISAGAELGIRETHGDTQKGVRWNTWNGHTRVRGPKGARHRKLYDIALDCDDRWGPSFEGLDIGAEVTLHSSKHDASHILAGQTSVILRRFPVPEASKPSGYAVLCERTNDGTPIPCTVVGRTVTIEPQDVHVKVYYRPIRPCLVVEIDPGKADEITGRQTWGLKLVDRSVPPEWTP